MDAKARIIQLIDDKQQEFIECSDAIWGYAETRFATRQSADAHIRVLENEGFQVVRGVAHMDNAFVATYGTGKPVIGILAEYDALANLSQVADLPEKKYLVDHGSGHGCGHNLLGAGALAGAVGIKSYMEECGLRGTIKYFGCPAEESGYGKSFMAKFGVFDGIDAALTWHPSDASLLWSDGSLAVAQMYFNFKGRAAHAAAAPEMGRSALDAAELMNMGVQFLRDHIIDSARIHYAFMDAGGESANVVQPSASLYYFIRAPKSDQVLDIYKRVEKIAQGAALMTETEVEIVWDSACKDYVPNKTLGKVLHENMMHFMPLEITPEEEQYEKALSDTAGEASKKALYGRAKMLFPQYDDAKHREMAAAGLLKEPVPAEAKLKIGGSTDVGDVSWVAPTAMITVACEPQGTPPHSWQWVANGKSSAAHKGMLVAGKSIAMTAYDLLTRPELLEAAAAEQVQNLNGENYHSIIPDGTLPR